jgi:hypothetical protein
MAYAEATSKADAPIYRTTAPIKRMTKTNLTDSEANTFLEAADEIRNVRKRTFGRDYLSVTVKVEDLVVVLDWIRTHQIPHYYVQVFFDSIYLLSFERILRLLSDASAHEESYWIQQHEKNQMKRTIHIDIDEGHCLSTDVQRPETDAETREHPDGRLQNYVSFQTPDDHLEEIVMDEYSVRELLQTD